MIRFALFLGLVLHVAVAVWNGFFGPSFGADGDALAFHKEALYYASNLGRFEYVTGWVYAYFLGILYRLFSDHIFFGSMVSVVAWYFSAKYVEFIMKSLFQSSSRTAIVLLLYGIWPSVILNTSVTLRESFQLLSINMMIYAAINIFAIGNNKWLTLIFAMLIASALHGALLVFSGAVFVYTIYLYSRDRLKLSPSGRGVVLSFSLLIILFSYSLFGNVSYNIDNGIIDAVQSYNEGAIAINARADFRSQIYFSGPLDFLTFLPIAFFQYMMEPIPRHISSAADAAVFLENAARAGLLIWAVFINRRASGANRDIQSFILLSYIGLEVIWSIGTVNWGTASRHHVPGMALLLIASMQALGSQYAVHGRQIGRWSAQA